MSPPERRSGGGSCTCSGSPGMVMSGHVHGHVHGHGHVHALAHQVWLGHGLLEICTMYSMETSLFRWTSSYSIGENDNFRKKK